MQEWKIAYVNKIEVPVLISDEKEALLAAKAAGRAIVGLWRPGQEMEEISAAKYVVENPEDVTEEYLERVARRHLGLPWHICETERLVIREMFADDFDEVWENQIGHGFGSVEELEAYTKNQYAFYEFGFWAVLEKASGELVGVAGLKVPEDEADERYDVLILDASIAGCLRVETDVEIAKKDMVGEPTDVSVHGTSADAYKSGETLELGYHIFPQFRRKRYALEACRAILKYGIEELGAARFLVRIDKENRVSKRLAEGLGFLAGN